MGRLVPIPSAYNDQHDRTLFDMIGQVFSHYRVIEMIGSGGMGNVYRATDTRLGRSVALKFVPDHLAEKPLVMERFRQEAKAASALNHPNICTVYDIGEEEGKAFIVMELLEGETLRDRLQRGLLPCHDCLDIACQIGSALQAAHARGIIHRDIKPANIFLTLHHGAKILDFGVAKMLGVEKPDSAQEEPSLAPNDAPNIVSNRNCLTDAGVYIGTVGYMSPEQARGDSIDTRTDLFSFGTVLYEMVTGKPPFLRNTVAATIDALLYEAIIRPSDLNQQCNSDMDSIILRAMARNLEERYSDASSLIADIQRLQHRAQNVETEIQPRIPMEANMRDFADSIGVLPFENAAADFEMEYLGDGIAEALINRLARFKQLRVVPRTTAFRYRDCADPLQAGRDLRVRLVLTGRVVQAGQVLSLKTELVDASNHSHIWGENYPKRKMSDLFDLQEEIVTEIAKRLQLEDKDSGRLRRGSRPNRDAYQLLVKGSYYLNKWNSEGITKGLQYARQSIEADPACADSYALLAYAYCMLGYFGVVAPRDAFPKAKAAAIAALELDESSARGHFSLGMVHFLYEWNWAAAESAIKRGLNLTPNDAAGHFLYGELLIVMGRDDEALKRLELALDLNPLSSPIAANLAAAYYFAGQTDRALEQAQKTQELDPSFIPASAFLAVLLARSGRHEEALAEALECISLPGSDLRGRSTLALVHALAGRSIEALDIAISLEAEPSLRRLTCSLPYIYGVLGLRDRALASLQEACEERVSSLVFVRRAPELMCLHEEPRFAELLGRIGLPPLQLSARL